MQTTNITYGDTEELLMALKKHSHLFAIVTNTGGYLFNSVSSEITWLKTEILSL